MFIYLRDGNLFLTIPIIGGVDIATDNTCKTFKVIKKFIENVEDELDFFQNILKISDDDNSEMIRQIQNYKGLLKILVQQNAFNNIDEYDFNSTGLSKVLKELNCMVLDPQTYRDNFLKSTPEFNTFSLAHKRFGDQNYNTQSTFGLKLRQEIGKVKSIEVKTPTVDEFINDINKGNLKGIEIRGGDSEEVLNYFKSLWLGLEWPEDKWDSAKNIIQKALDQLYKYVYYHQNFAIDSDDITGLMSNLRDNWFLIFRDNLNSIAKDILSSPLEEQVKIDKISVLVQFFIANANIYLKDINPSTLNIGARLDQDKDLSETFSKLITTTLSNGNDVEDAILEFLHEEGLLKNITPEQKQEIKNLFYARYNTIKESPHFDEFFILPRNTESNWFSYAGAFSLDFSYFASKYPKANREYKEFISEQNQKFARLTREDDNSLKFSAPFEFLDLNNKSITLTIEKLEALENLIKMKYKGGSKIIEVLMQKIIDLELTDQSIKQKLLLISVITGEIDLCEKIIDVADLNFTDKDGTPLLQLAIQNKQYDIAKLLIEKGADIEQKDKDGRTALHYSAIFAPKEFLEELIEKVANVDIQDNHGETALHYASLLGKNQIVETLLENGANLDIQDIQGRTALQLAIEYKKDDIAKLLIEKDADINIQHNNGLTALLLAILYRQYDIAKLLIENGANLDTQDINGKTALHLAILNRQDDIAKLLIENGANLDIKYNGKTALHLAIEDNQDELAKLLIEKGADLNIQNRWGTTALHLAIEDNQDELAKLLIEKGANIDIKDNYGKTALHSASIRGNKEMVQLLLEKGANMDIQNNKRTALQSAIYHKRDDIAKLLIENGANLDIKDDGKTALHLAILNRQDDIAKLLIENGANLDIKYDGKTALHLVIWCKQYDIAKLLIEKGADLNIQHKNGLTYLHLAILYSQYDIAKLLIENGANLDIKDDGKTALHYALRKGKNEIVQLLIEKGANIDTKDDNGNTALHYASIRGNKEIVQLLIENGANINIKNIWGEAAYQDNTTTIIAITTVIVVAAFVTLGLLIPPLGLIFFGVAIGSFGIGITAWASYPRINNSKIVNSENTPLTSPVVRTGKQTTSDTELSTIDNSNEPRPGS